MISRDVTCGLDSSKPSWSLSLWSSRVTSSKIARGAVAISAGDLDLPLGLPGFSRLRQVHRQNAAVERGINSCGIHALRKLETFSFSTRSIAGLITGAGNLPKDRRPNGCRYGAGVKSSKRRSISERRLSNGDYGKSSLVTDLSPDFTGSLVAVSAIFILLIMKKRRQMRTRRIVRRVNVLLRYLH